MTIFATFISFIYGIMMTFKMMQLVSYLDIYLAAKRS